MLDSSFRPWLCSEISLLQKPNCTEQPASCVTRCLFTSTHIVYVACHFERSPMVGYKCMCMQQEACLWVCINVQYACLYNKYTVVYHCMIPFRSSVCFLDSLCKIVCACIHNTCVFMHCISKGAVINRGHNLKPTCLRWLTRRRSII